MPTATGNNHTLSCIFMILFLSQLQLYFQMDRKIRVDIIVGRRQFAILVIGFHTNHSVQDFYRWATSFHRQTA